MPSSPRGRLTTATKGAGAATPSGRVPRRLAGENGVVSPRHHELGLGAHVSIAEGHHLACERGRALGCEAIQIFTKNQRQWRSPPLDDEACARFRNALAASGARIAFAHDSYLVNLASPQAAVFRRSVEAFVDDLERCERLGLSYLVTHPGSHTGSGEGAGIIAMRRGLDEALRRTRGSSVRVLLETPAGQGGTVGRSFEELASIVDGVREPERLGVCLDTCHVFAAGYDIRTRTGWEDTIARFDTAVGLERLRAFHVNDSKRELGSRVDRHENIGEGKIGLEAFRCLMNEARFREIPKVIETPMADGWDRRNLGRLRRLAASTRSQVASRGPRARGRARRPSTPD
jgi:deoxyribonuclease-4